MVLVKVYALENIRDKHGVLKINNTTKIRKLSKDSGSLQSLKTNLSSQRFYNVHLLQDDFE